MLQNHNANMSNESKRAISTNLDIVQAMQELKSQLGNAEFNLIIFFASPIFLPDKISKAFQKTFPNSQTVGCTTAGEIFEGELLQDSIVAMAFNKNIIKDFNIEIIDNSDDLLQVNKALQSFSKQTGVKLSEIDSKKYVGILLTDGLHGGSENIISRINEIIEIPFIGGAAGDNFKIEHAYLYVNGKYYENAAVLILIEPTNGYKILKTQSFEPVGKVFTVTSADEKKRCIKTIENIPAALFYAQQIGIPVSELQEQFINYSIGQIIYDEAYLHDSINFDKDYNLYLYSSIPEGAEVQVLKITDIIKDMRKLIETQLATLKNISAILNFNCASRQVKLQKENQEKEFGALFKGYPVIGFATYGEFYISFINQTSVILVLF